MKLSARSIIRYLYTYYVILIGISFDILHISYTSHDILTIRYINSLFKKTAIFLLLFLFLFETLNFRVNKEIFILFVKFNSLGQLFENSFKNKIWQCRQINLFFLYFINKNSEKTKRNTHFHFKLKFDYINDQNSFRYPFFTKEKNGCTIRRLPLCKILFFLIQFLK